MKERIKSALLVLLVFMNLILGSQVLSTKKLWSDDGYNFFLNMLNLPSNILKNIKAQIKKTETTPTKFERPEFLIINTGYQTSRHLIRSVDEDFLSTLELATPFLSDAFSHPERFSKSSDEELRSALSSKSLYLKYPTKYSSSLFSYLLGKGSGDFSGSFSELSFLIISADGNLYVKDSDTGIVYKNKTSASTSDLNSLIDAHASNDEQSSLVINYAFDLGFDKTFATQKTILSPIIPIYSESFTSKTVTAERLIVDSTGEIDNTAISTILPYFGMNPNGLRRYTEVDGTVVYVENNSVLKISPNGLLDYQANDEGILLSKSVTPSINESISAIAGFVDKVNIASGSESPLILTSNLTSSELNNDIITVTLDYTANGSKIMLNNSNAVTLTIQNGRIISYRHLFRSFTVNDERVLVNDYIFALDNAIANYENQINGIEISDLEIAYNYDTLEQKLFPQWIVSVKEIVIDE